MKVGHRHWRVESGLFMQRVAAERGAAWPVVFRSHGARGTRPTIPAGWRSPAQPVSFTPLSPLPCSPLSRPAASLLQRSRVDWFKPALPKRPESPSAARLVRWAWFQPRWLVVLLPQCHNVLTVGHIALVYRPTAGRYHHHHHHHYC